MGPVIVPEIDELSNSGSETDEMTSIHSIEGPLSGPSTFPARFQHPRGGAGLSWNDRKPPSELQALDGIEEIENLLHPQRDGPQKRYKESSVGNCGKKVLQNIKLLNLFTRERSNVKGQWMAASEQATTAISGNPSKSASRKLRENAKQFLAQKQAPKSPYGSWNRSRIDTDEGFAQEINLYLQSKGKYVKADDIAVYLSQPDVQEKWGLKKSIGRATCKRWMHKLSWRWVKTHKGLYADGHERDDVMKYRQSAYLPAWYALQSRMRTWGQRWQ